MKVGRLKREVEGKVVAPYPYTYIHEVNYQQPDYHRNLAYYSTRTSMQHRIGRLYKEELK